MVKKSIKKDIAIIGISGKFPKSADISAFWDNLVKGNEMVHFYQPQELERLGVPPSQINDGNYIPISSRIDEPENFDFSFFGYSHQEATAMDPQVRLLHEYSWKALEDAGINPDEYKGKIGTYFAAGDNPMWRASSMLLPNEDVNSFFLNQISNKNFVSSLIAYNLNLKGPSYYVDTACSSSLVSIHLACRNLLLKECSVAIAGGVKIDCSSKIGYRFEEGMIHSKDGHCRSFDKDSSGTIAGEGVGVVVLKRLEDAINDRDNIYAVVKSSSVNNDGNRKIGYTAPSVIGQFECIKLAQNIAGIKPHQIDYIEAHGTATKIGDPIEIKALNKAFESDVSHSCAIGSVKSNMGHLDAAAGVTGLIKTVLALKNKQIPPSINFTEANPDIDFDKGPFKVVTELTAWDKKNGEPRIAGVSSFGIGGTNAHAILEEAPLKVTGSSSRRYQIIPFSAKTLTAFDRNKAAIREFITENQECSIPDLAYTLKTGRKSFEYKDFGIIDTNDGNRFINQEEKASIGHPKKNVFLFSGQGSQFFKMGKAIYQEEAFFKEIMDAGFKHLKNITGDDYAQILGYTREDLVDEDKINNTKYTQPALFLLEYALAKLLINWGVKPTKMIGHSLGEYSAACIAEVFSFEDGLNLVVKRAELMGKMEPGDMIAIGFPFEEVEKYLSEGLALAALNTPSSCVVSGKRELIADLMVTLNKNEVPYKLLKTSHAFHSEMMDEVLEEFETAVKKMDLNAPKIPFISNVTGKEIKIDEATSSSYWAKQLRSTVRFSEGVKNSAGDKNLVFIEVGPGKTLINFVRQIAGTEPALISTLLGPIEKGDERLKLANALGSIWKQGIQIDWINYYQNEERNKLALPHYSFDKYKFPVKLDLGGFTLNQTPNNVEDWYHLPKWKRSFESVLAREDATAKTYLVFIENDQDDIINAFGGQQTIITVSKAESFSGSGLKWFVNPNSENDFEKLFEALKAENIDVESIIYTWKHTGTDAIQSIKFTEELIQFFKAIIEQLEKTKISFVSQIDSHFQSELCIGNQIATALTRVFAQENPLFEFQFVSVDQSTRKEHSQCLMDQVKHFSAGVNIRYREGKRWSLEYEKISLKKPSTSKAFKTNGTYLITGGQGKVGQIITKYLREEYQATLFHIGRSGAEEKVQEGVHYLKVDISNKKELEEGIRSFESSVGAIDGVLHLAGNTNNSTFKPIIGIDEEIISEQFKTKAIGTANIYELFKERSIDFVWISSSLSTVLGGLTFGAYAAANAFINSFVESKQLELKNWFCVNLDGISDLSKNAIGENEIIEILETSFLIEEFPELIVSSKNIEETLNHQKELLQTHNTEQDDATIVARPNIMSDYQPPETEVEIALTVIWRDFFKMDKVGVNDNFFDLGGDSLKGMTVSKRIQNQFEIEIDLNEFYNKPTIFELAREIELAKRLNEIQKGDNEGFNKLKI